MVKKSDAIDLLNSIVNEFGSNNIGIYITKINGMSDREWLNFLEINNIDSLEKLDNFAKETLSRGENSNGFKNLNVLISYGISGNTLHIHVVPKNIRFLLNRDGIKKSEILLIDALEKIKSKIMDEKNGEFDNIDNIYAVSDIIKRPISILFENLGFDVRILKNRDARGDNELSKFYDIFKKGRTIGRAIISKEMLLSDEWELIKNKRMEELGYKKQEIEGSYFRNQLREKVNCNIGDFDCNVYENDHKSGIDINGESKEDINI